MNKNNLFLLILLAFTSACVPVLTNVEYTPSDLLSIYIIRQKNPSHIAVYFDKEFIEYASTTIATSDTGKNHYAKIYVGKATKNILSNNLRKIFSNIEFITDPEAKPSLDVYDFVFVPSIESTALSVKEGKLVQETIFSMTVESNFLSSELTYITSSSQSTHPYKQGEITTPQLQDVAKEVVSENLNDALQQFLLKISAKKELEKFNINRLKQLHFVEAQENERKTAPPKYKVTAKLVPNNLSTIGTILNAGEKVNVSLAISNGGRGIGYATKILLTAPPKYKDITFPKEIDLGDIHPGTTVNKIFKVAATPNIESGLIPIAIKCLGNSGTYDNATINIQTKSLIRPLITISQLQINDQTGQFVIANGNGIVENGETIELTATLKNTGKGEAHNMLVTMSAEPQIIKIGAPTTRTKKNLGPNDNLELKWQVSIPRKFDATQIKLNISANDERGFVAGEESFFIRTEIHKPILTANFIIFDNQHRTIGNRKKYSIENGDSGQLDVIVSNEGDLPASEVSIKITSSNLIINKKETEIDIIRVSEQKKFSFHFDVPRSLGAAPAQIEVQILQKDFVGLTQSIMVAHQPFTP